MIICVHWIWQYKGSEWFNSKGVPELIIVLVILQFWHVHTDINVQFLTLDIVNTFCYVHGIFIDLFII